MGGCNLIDFEDEHEPVHMFEVMRDIIRKYSFMEKYLEAS